MTFSLSLHNYQWRDWEFSSRPTEIIDCISPSSSFAAPRQAYLSQLPEILPPQTCSLSAFWLLIPFSAATMLSSKSKSGLSDASINKSSPATPRASKIGRPGTAKTEPDSASPLQNARPSTERSPRSAESKTPVEQRRSPKISTLQDKQPRAPTKGSELQTQLSLVQEELKKAKERVLFVEKEKIKVLEELKDVKRSAEEENEKLQEALAALKRAEENSEIEKFRADELEQASIEAAQKREEEWQKEVENVRDQHALDVSALLATTQELQRVKHELAMTTDAKNTALSHADDAMKIAEINAEKVELLSGEVSRLKTLLDSKLESKSLEVAELVKKLDSEIVALKEELEKAKAAEGKLVDMEALIEGLKIEVTDAKQAESDAAKNVDEWKKKAELLETQLDEARVSERSLLDSLASVRKELEESNDSLQDAESEISVLKGKLESLEIELATYKQSLDDSNQSLDSAQKEAIELRNTVEVLKSNFQKAEAEKMQALNDEKTATTNLQSLSEEKKILLDELEMAREDGEKVKKAMDDLTSALHEVSAEARDAQEKLLVKQAEVENANNQIEELQLTLRNTQEKYEVVLDEAKYEAICLKNSIEKLETEAKNSKAEWDEKESEFITAVKKSVEEITAIKVEMSNLADSLKGAENEAQAAKEDGGQLMNKLKQVESELTIVNKAVEEAEGKSLELKERLLDKENEVQSITQENDELRVREAAAQEKIKELSALLAEATAKKPDENDEVDTPQSEKEYEVLPKKSFETVKENAEDDTEPTENTKIEESVKEDAGMAKEENGNGNVQEEAAVAAAEDTELKTYESCKITDKDLQSERDQEAESVEDENDAAKTDNASVEQTNGLSSENADNGATSPAKHLQQKKKKALLQKFGNLLKKKNNHK
ncbi:WEB family protein At3g02930, chloroplastic-like isoform X2 [Dioscorea cayenensis subsp. rotundata]|uniref:WEB family protein At3g02930, chloroplastic-like isoform X2 n=1 Tax=Dioscorea cayennensis subsp. rotundata TaxID=55577 RepID=A0AB40B4Y9_DIOCR|nr:WEB family protein At3g02930, chloroplastic-like isoform X2 [Dioscorea cayenensis subsp. rotundata]